MQALRSGDQRCIHRAQWQITIAPHELRDAEPVSHRYRLGQQGTRGKVSEESGLGFGAETRGDEIDDRVGERLRQVRVGERVLPVTQREALPGEVEPALVVVEREQDDDEDRLPQYLETRRG